MFFISEAPILEGYFIIETAAVCFILEAFVLIKQSQKSLLKSTIYYFMYNPMN